MLRKFGRRTTNIFRVLLKEYIFLLFLLLDKVSLPNSDLLRKSENKSIKSVFVKFDALGDLFLILPFLQRYSGSNEYLVITDEKYKEFLELFEIQFLPVKTKSMLLNPLYRFRMIHFISSIRSAEVFNLNVSRPNILSDPICSYLDSERKVAFVGDGVNSSYLARFLYDDIFQKLIVATNVSHELQKLSVFFQFTPEYELKLPKAIHCAVRWVFCCCSWGRGCWS